MKLYTFDKAPNPRRLGLFLAYKGITLETEQIDLMALEQHGERFAAINPQRTVPTLLLDDGSTMTEVIGICWYLESLYPERPLLGRNAREQADILGWDHRIFLQVFMPIAEMLRNGHENFKDRALPGPHPVKQLPELVERGRARLHHCLPEVDAHLAAHPFLVGTQCSFADIDLFCALEFAGWVREGIPEHCKNLQAWQERCKSEFQLA